MASEEETVLQFLRHDIRAFDAKVFGLEFISAHGLTPASLLRYAYHNDAQVAFRASWLLEHTAIKAPQIIRPIYPDFMRHLSSLKNWSCIRSFSKIGMIVTKPPRQWVEKNDRYDEIWIEQCFDWIITPSCPVAVVVNCLDILYYLSVEQEWIREELTAQIQHLLKTPSPALTSRAKRILKRLQES
ncbi:hypothetical protein [Sphingobacterium paludis]|uniref:DNA alkylation repair enzyme n=1 Tax=Sphingobacterium paludis TaxID=1476465 RepID=A0A4R7D8V7_9SPHI|nr:hypothetical protein [Sphingobacterium paludis]TDS17713.1 hypothetical protein B0I21_101584 [Sphingobacterium paludis]